MSRRNQSRRRRAYAKRQHEVRQRRDVRPDTATDWSDAFAAGLDEIAERGSLGSFQAELTERRHGGRAAA
jgi:hypothetical protein